MLRLHHRTTNHGTGSDSTGERPGGGACVRSVVLSAIDWPCGVVAALLVLSGMGGCSWPGSATEMPVQAGTRPSAKADHIVALGRIEPSGGVCSITGTPGARIGRFAEGVEVGQGVAADQPLFWLADYEPLDATCRAIAAQIDEANALLAVEAASTELSRQELEAEATKIQQLDPLDVDAQHGQVAALERKLEVAESELEKLRRLVKGGSSSVSEQQVDAQSLLVEGTRTELDVAKIQLEKLKRGRTLSEQSLALKERQLEVASEKGRLSAQLETLKVNHEAAVLQRDQAVIKAPCPGRILDVLTRPGETIGNQPVLQLGNVEQMVVVAEVSETYLGELEQADEATITTTAVKGLVLHGRIAPGGIGWMIGKNRIFSLNPTVDADQRVVEVRIALDEESSRKVRKYTNLQVDVEIPLARSDPRAMAGRGRIPPGGTMKTPLAWYNLLQERLRTLVATGGVTFALVLVFMQLGFLQSVWNTATLVLSQMDFDIAIVAPSYQHLGAAGDVPQAPPFRGGGRAGSRPGHPALRRVPVVEERAWQVRADAFGELVQSVARCAQPGCRATDALGQEPSDPRAGFPGEHSPDPAP